MIINQHQLYTDLMALPDPFNHKDHTIDGQTFRSFCYALIGKPDMWTHPGAKECRGHTFDITDESRPELVSLPMGKFFNLGEKLAPPTLCGAKFAMPKLDGSLIMTYRRDGGCGFGLKTKMGFDNEMVEAAEAWLSDDQRTELSFWVFNDCTVCMEWTSPDNVHVVAQAESRLTVICYRCHRAGYTTWAPKFRSIDSVGVISVPSHQGVYDAIGTEGVVIIDAEGSPVKLKSGWYLKRHRWADAPVKNMVAAVMAGEADDLRAMVHDCPDIVARLDVVEAHVVDVMAAAVDLVKVICDLSRRHSVDRGDFAKVSKGLLAEMGCHKALHMPVMQSYAGEPNWPKFWAFAPNVKDLIVDTFKEAR